MTWGLVRRTIDGSTKGLMIGPNSKRPTLEHVPKVSDCQVDAEEFAVKRAIFDLGGRHLLGEESYWLSIRAAMGQHGADRNVGSIGGEG